MSDKYIAYTDGSFQSSINAGGWSSVIMKNNEIIKILYQGHKNTTNNREEIRGVLETLKFFKTPVSITIVSDSQYVINSITKGYVKRWFDTQDYSKKNLDLWFELLDLLEFHDVTFQWVKGHNEHEYNELADLYAQHAAQCLNLKEDVCKNNIETCGI